MSPLLNPSTDELAGEGAYQGEGDESPAEPAFHPQVYDDGNGDVDIKVPWQGELPASLPQVAEWKIYDNGQKYQADERQDVVHSFHSHIVETYHIIVNVPCVISRF